MPTTTEIERTIASITGTSANADYLESAQRFVVSAIPKEMLWFAATSSAVSNSSGIDITSADSVLSVDRNSFPSTEVPFAASKWIDDSSSLRKATVKHPMHYSFSGKIFIKPDPDSSDAGTVYYVDYAQIDDDCDLRNAVIYRACASEFTELASSELPDILSLLSLAPTTPGDPTISYESASVGDAISTAQDPVLGAQDAVSTAQDSYTGETDTTSSTDASGTLSITPGSSSPGSGSEGTATAGSSTASGAIFYQEQSAASSGGALTGIADGTFGTEVDMVSIDKWWDVAGEIIEIEEDAELARAQVEKIQAYITAFRMEVENAKTSMQAKIEDARLKTQVAVTNAAEATKASLSNSQTETQASIETGKMLTQSNISDALEITKANMAVSQSQTQASITNATNDNRTQVASINSQTTAGISKMQGSTQAAVAKMQQSTTAAIQKMTHSTQAAIMKMQQSTNVNVQNAARDLQGSIQNYQLKVQKFQADVGKFQISMTSEIQRYQSKIAKEQAYSKEADKYYLWANNEINTYIKSNMRGRAAMSQMPQQKAPPPQRQRQRR